METSIVIEFYTLEGEMSKIVTHIKRKKGFIKEHTSQRKYEKKLEKALTKHCFTKTIYEDPTWAKNGYQEKYEDKLRLWYPMIHQFIKIYKDSIAWAT
jgi:hypothetical protein